MTKNTGGPAFPRDHDHDGHNGMDLRDYFAAKAVAFLVPLRASHQTPWPDLAESAYEMADAMLKEREK